ncbi:hypothetical protein UREOM_0360 [Ureaplasma sp. OM1]|uniref:Uncharacterized protein n=1 Tax=Ureaplasma ceti TaxID=3119530 RepID=A0ABP9U4N8_9BACT
MKTKVKPDQTVKIVNVATNKDNTVNGITSLTLYSDHWVKIPIIAAATEAKLMYAIKMNILDQIMVDLVIGLEQINSSVPSCKSFIKIWTTTTEAGITAKNTNILIKDLNSITEVIDSFNTRGTTYKINAITA